MSKKNAGKTTEVIEGLVTTDIAALSAGQLAALSTSDIVVLGTGAIDVLSTAMVDALTTSSVMVLGTTDIDALSPAAVQAPDAEQFEQLDVHIDTSVGEEWKPPAGYVSVTDQIGAASNAALADGDHPAYAALDDLHQLLHAFKVKAAAALPKLSGDAAELVDKLQYL